MELKDGPVERKVPMQYGDIKKEIRLLMNNKDCLGIKISSKKYSFDPRKSKCVYLK